MDTNINIKIALADDHTIVLDGFTSILSTESDLKIVGTAKNGKELLQLLQANLIDVVLLDINMPLMDGIEATKEIKARFPQTKIIILTMLGDAAHIKQLVDLGVEGYLLKNTDKKTLLHAIHTIYNGSNYFDGEVTKSILNKFKQKVEVEEEEIILSERELEIIALIAKGLQTIEIADKLFLSPHTIKTHRKNINFKLGIHSPAELIAFAKSKNLIG